MKSRLKQAVYMQGRGVKNLLLSASFCSKTNNEVPYWLADRTDLPFWLVKTWLTDLLRAKMCYSALLGAKTCAVFAFFFPLFLPFKVSVQATGYDS